LAKVFGVGLSRTGTKSLAVALRRLGFTSVHFPCDPITQAEIAEYCGSGASGLRLSVLESFDAIIDTPVCCAYKALDVSYPGSKFILTVRKKESWLTSCERYWKYSLALAKESAPDASYNKFIDFVNLRMYGIHDYDIDHFSKAYDEYLQDISTHFEGRDKDLLVLDICGGEGWNELCSFLGRQVPDHPFPWETDAV
jgi:hypothetical protein